MDVNKGENIALSLQLVKSDGISVEENATVSYSVYDATGIVELVSSQTTTYNSITQSYVDTLVPSASWVNQEVGHYLIVWSVEDTTDDFNSIYTEQLNINIDKVLIDRILGLVHQNIVIDQTKFDQFGNLIRARLRIFKEASKTNVLATYRITANPSGPGQFSTWEQVEE